MTVSYRTAITIVQFIFFTPATFLSTWLCVKDGIKQASTWRFIATLSLLRMAGDISYFISLSHPGTSVETAVIVCELLGLAPLMLILVAFVARANQTTKTYPGKASLIITLASVSGLILGIVGTDRALEHATTTSDVGSNSLIQAALGLFIGSYGLMFIAFIWVCLDVLTSRAKRAALGPEIGLIYTVALAAPFTLVRFIYSALGDYSKDPQFSVLYGDNTTYLFMDVLMEMAAVAICLASSFFVPPPPKQPKKEKKKDGDEEQIDGETGSDTQEHEDKSKTELETTPVKDSSESV